MNAQKCLEILRKIKDVSFATVDEKGLPQVRIIDVMIVEDEKLYFCTARGKDFYKQLLNDHHVAISAMNEKYQMVRLSGIAEKLEDQTYWINQKERRMIMLQNMWTTFITEKSLFIKLFVEHIEISLIAILIAIVLGGVVGILISEFERSAKLTLGVINQKKINVMVIFTTDGQLTASDVTVLKDDKQFYLCGNVIRNEVLKKHPELKKVFKKLEGTITDHLNLSIQEGEFVTMIGSSGCGKTTTLKMVNGLITPDQGDILVHGENIKTKEVVSKWMDIVGLDEDMKV